MMLDGIHHVHFVGIAGIGMSGLARYLHANGYHVSGSDRAPGEQGEALRNSGILVMEGHAAENIDGADLVVMTSAATVDTPEIRAAQNRGIPVVKRAALLGAIFDRGIGIAVAGTHGKTTTSALIAHILVETGRDPTVLIGGISKNLGSNARVGGDIIVAEADEYDASFLHLHPRIAIITNVEADHPDFYPEPGQVTAAFRDFAKQVTGPLIVCADDPGVMPVAKGHETVITYGLSAGDWRAAAIREDEETTVFTIHHGSGSWPAVLRIPGEHMIRNALAAVAVAVQLDIPIDQAVGALAGFLGVERRLDVIGEAAGVLVIDSYGHHPTEIRSDLAAIRRRYHRPIRLVFQPHTYSRTRAYLQDFARSFSDADTVYLLDIYAARETDTLGTSSQELAREASKHHAVVRYSGHHSAVLDQLVRDAQPGDLVVTMGAGDVTSVAPALLEALG